MSQKRSIFEDVSEGEGVATRPQTGLIDRNTGTARGAIRLWLMLLFALVVIMIAVGGLTRLTDSGLSITEWKPLSGALPPTSAEIWQSEFDKYRAIPEYQLQNKGMTLAEFKVIYWWEWGHRQLGRVIGLVWALGFFYFLLRKQIPTGWTPRLLVLGALGGLQGAIGWWMVSSGLTGTMLDVASYRLATHLGLAFVILGLISWYVFLLERSERDLLQVRRSGEAAVFSLSTFLVGLAFFQILLGALVAGIDAGRNYTDWPLMAGGVFPPDPFELTPLWRNFFEDDGLVQFIHRIMGYVLFAFGVFVVLQGRKSSHPVTTRAFTLIGALLVLQMLIGIMTVMYSAPWQIAIIHQLGAVALWVAILRGRYLARYPVLTSLRGATA